MRPNKLYLIGAGRHTATRQLRRTSRILRRVIRVGELTISHRRIDVDRAFVGKHLEAIIGHMRKGVLIVAHSGDSFVDEAELRAMFTETSVNEVMEGVKENLNEVVGDEGGADDIELTDEEKAKILTEMDELSDEAKAEITEFGGYVPSSTEIDEFHNAHPGTGPDEPEPVVLADSALPVVEAVPEVVKTARELPDTSAMTKKQLVALCEELGIEVKGSPNNATLHDMLNAWKNS